MQDRNYDCLLSRTLVAAGRMGKGLLLQTRACAVALLWVGGLGDPLPDLSQRITVYMPIGTRNAHSCKSAGGCSPECDSG